MIGQQEKIKILGYILNNKLTHYNFINNIISKVNIRLYTLSLINKYMSEKNRIMICSSLIMSMIPYSMVLLINVNAKQIDILSVLVNKVARHCI